MRNKNVSKKRKVIDLLSDYDFAYINIVVNTYDIEYIDTKHFYNYFCRYLIERITWYVSENNGIVDIYFSNRSNISYNELKSYIEYLKISNNEVKPVINNIYVKDMWQLKMLQVADICASSTSEAFEKDNFGYIDERFLLTLSPKLYRRKGKLRGYGLKIFPDKYLNIYQKELKWLKDMYK